MYPLLQIFVETQFLAGVHFRLDSRVYESDSLLLALIRLCRSDMIFALKLAEPITLACE